MANLKPCPLCSSPCHITVDDAGDSVIDGRVECDDPKCLYQSPVSEDSWLPEQQKGDPHG